MARATTPAATPAWVEPSLPENAGLMGAGWLPETVCALSLVPLLGMVAGVLTVVQTATVLALAGALGVTALTLRERG
jgi:hypothetical protein